MQANINLDQYQQAPNALIFQQDYPENQPFALLLLAHGAGAPMDSPFMRAVSWRLATRGVGVLRFEFPYMAARRVNGVRRPPDRQPVLLNCWRQACQQVRQWHAGPMAIGGKSMGGRMASLLADEVGAAALVCFGYPFYAAGRPEKPRVAHLAALQTPSLIVQGERDAMGNRQAVAAYPLSSAIRLHWLATADHDLKPLQRSGFTHEQYLEQAAEKVAGFLREVCAAP